MATINMTTAITTNEFLFNVNAGFVVGTRQVRKSGQLDELDKGDGARVIWGVATNPTYPIANESISISSSSISDLSMLKVSGLIEEDGEWNEVSIEVALNGQTPVVVGNFIRICKVDNIGANSLVGDAYAYPTGSGVSLGIPITITDIRAKLLISRGTTLMAMYTVPSNHTAFIYRLYRASLRSEQVEFNFQHRPFGSVFRSLGIVPTYQASGQLELGYERFEEKSDIRIMATAFTNNSVASASFHMIICKNEYIDKI